MTLLRSIVSVATTLLVLSGPVSEARAVALSYADITYDNALLSQFNLVTLGNLVQSGAAGAVNTIGGRAIIGGNATFVGTSSSVCTGACGGNATGAIDRTGASFGALTVFGNLVAANASSAFNATSIGAGDVSVRGTSSGNLDLNNSGSVRVAGNAQGTKVLDATGIKTTQGSFQGTSYASRSFLGLFSYLGAGVTPQVSQSIASVFPFGTAYQNQVTQLSQGLAALPGTPGVRAQKMSGGDSIFFTAANDLVANTGQKYGVVTTTMAELAAMTNFKGINNGSNDATIVVVTGDGAKYTLPNLDSYAGANKVIFDFVDATTLRFGGNWTGSILAPLATIVSMGGTIDGSVVVNTINQSQALTATNLFIGDLTGLVPEPSSAAVLALGVAAAILLRRRGRPSVGSPSL